MQIHILFFDHRLKTRILFNFLFSQCLIRAYYVLVLLLITDVCIVGVARTPMGGFLGSLSSLSATHLGSLAIKCM
jgi:hypothetical protein